MKCISALSRAGKGRRAAAGYVPFRDSSLTWLLKESLAGNSRVCALLPAALACGVRGPGGAAASRICCANRVCRQTFMIAAVSPADLHYGLTLSTLRYANQAKQLQTRAVVNKDPRQKLISELRGEISQLREQLRATARPAAAVPGGLHAGAGGQGAGAEVRGGPASGGNGAGDGAAEAGRGVVDELRDVQGVLAEFEMTVVDKRRRAREIADQRREVLGGDTVLEGEEGEESVATLPFLVNLSEDALLAESLVYRLRPGRTRVFRADVESGDENELIAACDPSLPRGSSGEGTSGDSGPEAAPAALAEVPGDAFAFRLDGIGIAPFHCVITNGGGQRAVLACEGADVFVNGTPCDPGVLVQLRHNSRLVLGSSHFFRYTEPAVVAERRHRRRSQPPPAEQGALSLNPRDQIQRMRERRRTRRASGRDTLAKVWTAPESPVTGREGSVAVTATPSCSPDSASVAGMDTEGRDEGEGEGEGEILADSASVGDSEVTYEMAARELALGRMRRRSSTALSPRRRPGAEAGSSQPLPLASGHRPDAAGTGPTMAPGARTAATWAGIGSRGEGQGPAAEAATRRARLASQAVSKWHKLHSQTELEDRLVQAEQLIGEAEEIAKDLGEEVCGPIRRCPSQSCGNALPLRLCVARGRWSLKRFWSTRSPAAAPSSSTTSPAPLVRRSGCRAAARTA